MHPVFHLSLLQMHVLNNNQLLLELSDCIIWTNTYMYMYLHMYVCIYVYGLSD